MRVYTFKTEQFLPITLEEAWAFFSTPINLKTITPPHLNFKILSDLRDGRMYPGQIINYTVHPIMGIPLSWTTEITHVQDHVYFVDEQRFGPYAFWHHQHWFTAVEGGIMMEDIVSYALPLGILGRIAHRLFVRRELHGIFSYRTKVLGEIFPHSAE